MNETRDVKFTLRTEELHTVVWLAERRDIKPALVLRQAIGSEKYIQDVVDRGGKFLVQEADGTLYNVCFNYAINKAEVP